MADMTLFPLAMRLLGDLFNGGLTLGRCLWKLVAPMLGDVDAAAKPDVFKAPHMIKKLDQPCATPRPTDQPVMQADRKQLRRPFFAFAIEDVEGVPHVSEKVIAG